MNFAGKVVRGLGRLGRLASGAASSLVYGNDLGIANNAMGAELLERCRAAYRPPAGGHAAASRAAAEEFRRTGILSLPRFYEPALMQVIVSKLSRMMVDPRTSKPRDSAIIHGVPEATRNLRDPLRTLPELAQLVSPRLVDILEAYYAGHARVVALQVYRNAYVDLSALEAKEVFSSRWHFDRQHSAYMQLMVYFTDGVTRDTGAYQTHDIATSKRLVRTGYVTRNRIYGAAARLIDDPERIHYFEGGIGDAMLSSATLCLHRAGIPKPGTIRDVMLIHFEPAERPMPADWPAELEPYPGDDGFLVRRDRPVYNASDAPSHPAVVAYYQNMQRQLDAGRGDEPR